MRNLVYETRCSTCEEKELRKIEEEGDEEEEKKRKIYKIKIFKYVGETARREEQRALVRH